jgi:hypothetical protein
MRRRAPRPGLPRERIGGLAVGQRKQRPQYAHAGRQDRAERQILPLARLQILQHRCR